MLDASVIVHQLGDVRISEGDQFLLYLRNLPSKVQVHRNALTVQQLKTGVQNYHIRTRVQDDLGSVHVAQPVAAKSRFEGQDVLQLWKERTSAESCPEPKKCRKGHLAKDCWEKHPERKPAAKPKAKRQPTKPGGRGKGRGKGGRKTQGRGGNKQGEDEDEEQDEDYEDDGEPEGDDEEHPEPESEDPIRSIR